MRRCRLWGRALSVHPSSTLVQLRVATSNVLFDRFYRKWASFEPLMTLERRTELFASIMTPIVAKHDVVCFQELPLRDPRWLNVASANGRRLLITSQDPRDSDVGVAIAIDPRRLELLEAPTALRVGAIGQAGKFAVRAFVRDRTSGRRVMITSVHVPWTDQVSHRLALFRKAVPVVTRRHDSGESQPSSKTGETLKVLGKDVDAVVLAGDFNATPNELRSSAVIQHLLTDGHWEDASRNIPVTCLSERNVPIKIDYIYLCSANGAGDSPPPALVVSSSNEGLDCPTGLDCQSIPAAPLGHLILHHKYDVDGAELDESGTFSSDHVILSTGFDVSSPTKQMSPVGVTDTAVGVDVPVVLAPIVALTVDR
jgi:hypothetical protein